MSVQLEKIDEDYPFIGSASDEPNDSNLHMSKQDLSSLTSREYWLKLCPQLHICDQNTLQTRNKFTLSPENGAKLKSRLDKDGYFLLPSSLLPWGDPDAQLNLARAVIQLKQNGWSPSFISIFDEAWILCHQLSEIVYQTTGNKLNMDLLTFYVDPSQGAGFSPHRDRFHFHSPFNFSMTSTFIIKILELER
eukprot:TRINITY_DN1805_c0_g1_i2.p1 TRINITY_DN1805_c0_g1~~TRINITY_DN1805_c0_g1_i2.p1  ORF type:complete len:192 (-),score=24.31 TRINITY_DN1805_c0_g1_i2:966-1541(-)